MYDFIRESFYVTISNSTYLREMNVIAVGYNDDYENDKLTVGFKGA